MYLIWFRILVGVLPLVAAASLQGAELPARALDLSSWMLTLPVDTSRPGRPDEIKQGELESFVDDRYFFANESKRGVVFRAHCGGDTTKGSNFPRTELREMAQDGKSRAAWDTGDSLLHTMTMEVAITATPPVKQHVVCAQIHDADDDLMMVRLEKTKLFVERNSFGDVMLEPNYKLGTPFSLKIQAGKGSVQVWYEGELKMDWKVSRKGCYFKAGCYTQSNPSKGDTSDSYGEVVIYELRLGNEAK